MTDYQISNGIHTAAIHSDRHLEILNVKTGDLITLHGLSDEKMHRLIDVIFNRG